MALRFEITFRDGDMTVPNGQERVLNICKKLFWKEAPEDWKYFDGEIFVKYKEPIGIHDRAIIEFESSYWKDIIIEALKARRDVYSVKEME